MEEIALIVFPVDTPRTIFTLLVLLAWLDTVAGRLLARLDLLLLGLDLLPGLDLMPGLDLSPGLVLLPSLLPTLPPWLGCLPGLLIGLIVVIQASVLLQEPTVRSVGTWLFRLCPLG